MVFWSEFVHFCKKNIHLRKSERPLSSSNHTASACKTQNDGIICFSVNLIIQMFNYTYRKRLFIFSLFHCAIIGLYSNSPLSHTPCQRCRKPNRSNKEKKKIKKRRNAAMISITHLTCISNTKKIKIQSVIINGQKRRGCEVCSAWDEDIH